MITNYSLVLLIVNKICLIMLISGQDLMTLCPDITAKKYIEKVIVTIDEFVGHSMNGFFYFNFIDASSVLFNTLYLCTIRGNIFSHIFI